MSEIVLDDIIDNKEKKKYKTSLEWYYEHRDKVLLRNKSKPKVECKYCNRIIYANKLKSHNESALHLKRVNAYNDYMKSIDNI